MLSKLNQFIIRCSSSLQIFILLFVGFLATLRGLLFIGEKFQPHAGGALPFDLQNSLSREQIFAQLESYNDQAYNLYYIFTAIDYFFPLFAGLFLAAIWAYALRNSIPRWYQLALQKNLFVLLLIPTAFDWLENIALITTITAFPNELSSTADIAIIAKQIKLASTYLAQGSTLLIILIAAFIALKKRFSNY